MNLPFHTGQQAQTVGETLLVCLPGTVVDPTYTRPTLSNGQTVTKTHPVTLDCAGKGKVIETSRTLEKDEAQGREQNEDSRGEERKPDRKPELDSRITYPFFQKVTVEIHGPFGMINDKSHLPTVS